MNQLIKSIYQQVDKTSLYDEYLERIYNEFNQCFNCLNGDIEVIDNFHDKLLTFNEKSIEIDKGKLLDFLTNIIIEFKRKKIREVLSLCEKNRGYDEIISCDDDTLINNDKLFKLYRQLGYQHQFTIFKNHLNAGSFNNFYTNNHKKEILLIISNLLDTNNNKKLLFPDFLDFFKQDTINGKYENIYKLCNKIKFRLNAYTFKETSDYSSDYISILSKFSSLSFTNCTFYENFFIFFKTKINRLEFKKCDFQYENEWEYIQSESTLYSDCIFETYSHQNISEDKVEVNDLLFFNCTFNELLCNGIHFKKRLLKYNNLFGSRKDDNKKINKLELINCKFDKKLVISTYDMSKPDEPFLVPHLDLSETIFSHKEDIKSKVKFQNCDIDEGIFYNTKFEDLADFYKSKFKKVCFERTDFEKISVFSEVLFDCDVDFKYTKFLGKAIFRDTIITEYNKLNLRDSIFDAEANFLDISSTERIGDSEPKDIEVANRETARVIKNFYDNSNNIIEANRFYKLEMKEREDELNWKESPLEYLTFKIHGLASNHSQNWLLAFLLIFIVGFVASMCEYSTIIKTKDLFIAMNDVNIKMANVVNLIMVIMSICLFFIAVFNPKIEFVYTFFAFLIGTIYFIYTKDIKLILFAHTINPFSIMTSGDIINGLQLLFKIMIGYLLYQLVVSVRQNTRRK